MKYTGFLLWCVLLVSPTMGQKASPLVTDRPDFTESGSTIPKGTVQIEGGLTYTIASETQEVNGSELLVRWSPLQRFELRLQAPDYVLTSRESSASDPAIGLKAQLGPVYSWDLALIASTTLPLSSNEGGKAGLDLILAGGSDLGVISLGSQVMTGWSQEAGKLLHGFTVVVGVGITANTGGFLEAAISEVPAGEASVLLHSGVTIEVASLVQLDLHTGVGATATAPDFILGAGLSLRR